MRVTIYTKPGCHLCEDALDILDRLTPRHDLKVTEVNILDDMALYEAYHEDIPVIKIEDGRLGTIKSPIDESTLRTAFSTALRAYTPNPPPRLSSQSAQSVVRMRKEPLLDRIARYIGRHWLGLAVTAMGVFTLLPWLAPVFAAINWWGPANLIYTAYAFTCHQLPERAGMVMGYQVAFCYRNTALYGGTFLFGLLYALARDRHVSWLQWLRKPIPIWGVIILLTPMAIDGLTHMLGLRDVSMDGSFGSFYIGSQPGSLNWWLRIITGLLAALGAVWFAFPRMDAVVEESEAMRLAYQQSLARQQQAASSQ